MVGVATCSLAAPWAAKAKAGEADVRSASAAAAGGAEKAKPSPADVPPPCAPCCDGASEVLRAPEMSGRATPSAGAPGAGPLAAVHRSLAAPPAVAAEATGRGAPGPSRGREAGVGAGRGAPPPRWLTEAKPVSAGEAADALFAVASVAAPKLKE